MQNEVISKRICFIYYMVLLFVPIFEVKSEGDLLDFIYIISLFLSMFKLNIM